MKKIIAVVITIAMVMTMGITAFAIECPSTFGTEKTVDTTSSDWISAYSADTTWVQAWGQYIMEEGVSKVYRSEISQDDLNAAVVKQIEDGNVSKDTINTALQGIIDYTDSTSWSEKKKNGYKESVAALQTAVAAANEPADSGSGDSGSGDSGSTDKYTAEEYGKKIVDAIANGDSATTIASMVVTDLMGGKLDPTTIPDVISYVSENAPDDGSDTASGVLEFLENLVGNIGGDGGDFDPSSLIPGGTDGGIELPDLGGLGDLLGGFDLSSIGSLVSGIPIIGPIIAGLLGVDDGGDNGSGGGSNSNDNTWGDSDSGSGFDDFSNNDTGDMSFIAVGAVALVAGAALVLTRKKNEE